MLNVWLSRFSLNRNLIQKQIKFKLKVKIEVKNMVYLIVFTKFPTDKTAELVKIGIEVAKKFYCAKMNLNLFLSLIDTNQIFILNIFKY